MGCFKVSQGCTHCYAETLTDGKMGLNVFGPDTSKRKRTSTAYWRKPFKWDRDAQSVGVPAKTFCCSLADVFEDAPELKPWREDLWDVIRHCRWLDWQILTKRPENIERMLPKDWLTAFPMVGSGMERRDSVRLGMSSLGMASRGGWPHVWLGTSIESNKVKERSEILASVPAHTRFISYEPALAPMDQVSLDGIDWLICGGESGPGYRKMDLEWAFESWVMCQHVGIPFFFKQNSGARTETGIDALGVVVREFPQSWSR